MKGYINLRFATVEWIMNPLKKSQGFRFFRRRNYIEIFTKDKELHARWRKELQKRCILTDFKQVYDIGEFMGRGASAKVFEIIHKETKKIFAVKVFCSISLELFENLKALDNNFFSHHLD